MPRAVNKAGIDLVKQFEGFRAEAYYCPAGKLTIGYGHTRGVSQGDGITENEAEELLLEDLEDAGKVVERLVTEPITDNQFAALASFTFNVGATKLFQSTLLKKLNAGERDAVPAQLKRWTKARHPITGDMVDLPGLVRRRAAEATLWSTPDDV